MPDKQKKPRKSKEKALADRVYKHYKALKRNVGGLEFVPTHHCMGCVWSTWPHWHGYNKIVTPNSDWLHLAHTHGLTVRECKDIVSAKRGWSAEEAEERQKQAIKVTLAGRQEIDAYIKEKLDDAGRMQGG